MKRRLGLIVAGLVAVIGISCLATLPPATAALSVTPPPTTVTGAYHLHTNRSDGSGSVDDVARAAAAAGLQFLIITDHLTAANAALLPEAPAYRHGVLVIDGMEVSTRSGHLVALGLREPAPYPLAGEARDVIEDVHRLGGWTVAAHPESAKEDLRWRGRGADGIEWINADSEWRAHSAGRLLAAALHSLVRPAPAIASLFSRPAASLERWDRWADENHIAGLAAVDAHARIGIDEQSEPRVARTLLARPSYADMFRTLVQGVWLDQALSGDAAADAAHVLGALRAGRSYSAVTAIAAPAVLTVTHDAGTLRARVEGAPDAVVSIWRQGREVASAAAEVAAPSAAPGLYRIEVRWPGVDVPWIVSAPLFVPGDAPEVTTISGPPAPVRTIAIPPDGPWLIEQHPASTAAWHADAETTEFTFTLAPGPAPGQYAALVSSLDAAESFEEIRFTVAADRPMRFSVQVRLPDNSGGGERWVRSVYADTTPRAVRVRLEDFEPAGRPTTRRPVAARLQSLLFVVDAPHTQPGDQGRIRISGVSLVGPDTPGAVTSGR